MSEHSSGRALIEVIVAVVLVVATVSILLWVLSALASGFWWLLKLAVIALAIFLVVRLVTSRRR